MVCELKDGIWLDRELGDKNWILMATKGTNIPPARKTPLVALTGKQNLRLHQRTWNPSAQGPGQGMLLFPLFRGPLD